MRPIRIGLRRWASQKPAHDAIADAMRFLRWVVEAIEEPFLLSLIG